MADGLVPQTALDAPLDQRGTLDAWVTALALEPIADGTPRPKLTVIAAGRRAVQAPGQRAARPVASVGSAAPVARGNWIPTGPRNITGRVRALALHPTDPTIMYAGAASGGVFKSIDGGESWATAWTDQASPSIAAIGICRDHPDTVWVATGEIQAGGGESILGSGVYRSTDGGVTWTNAANPPIAGSAPFLAATFDAVAAHPTNPAACWAVGPAGILRTLDGGAHWSQYENGIYYSDVAFSFDASAAPAPVAFLVRAVSAGGEATVLRLDAPDDPSDANIATAIANPASASQPIATPAAPPPPADQWPARGKLAVCSGSPTVAYVRFVRRDDRHAGLFRTQNAQAAPAGGASAIVWAPIADTVNNTDAGFADEGQGGYDLAIGVNPANPSEIATGMLDVYVSVNANGPAGSVTFKRAMAEDLTFIARAQHGDQHSAIIAPPSAGAAAGTPSKLWVSNDGGISSSSDWETNVGYPRGQSVLPLPAGAITWRGSFGISGSQMYSLSQSPLLPTTFGCGFQDNGVLLTAGGLTWRVVIGADGGFVAFDPDDPYKLLASYQSAIDEVLFPAALEGGFALPGYPVREGLWPRDLTQGFLATDGALFVGDIAHHPRRGDRVLHARRNRLYGSTETSGDRWRPEPAGRGPEIQLTVPPTIATPAPIATLSVQASPAAATLGLPPQVSVASANPGNAAVASVRSLLPGPYALQDGDQLGLVVNGAPTRLTFNRSPAQRGAAWTAAEVAAAISTAAPAVAPAQLAGYPCFWSRPVVVEVTTTELGPGAQITLGGSALASGATPGLSPLGVRARPYHGTAGRPATVTLIAPHRSMAAPAGQAALELTLSIGAGGSIRTVTFDSAAFSDLSWIHAGELQRAIRAVLGHDPATVTALAVEKRLRISGTAANNLQIGGTAAPHLNVPGWTPALAPAPALEANVALLNSFDLSPTAAAPGTPLVLTINDGALQPPLTFNGTVNELRALTAEELEMLLQTHFTVHGIHASCSLEFVCDTGSPSEIVYSRTSPDTAMVGGTDGTLYRTTNDGGFWDTIRDPLIYGLDRQIEAIAIHPVDAGTAYVGLEGRPTSGLEDQAALTRPGLLFKTTDAGETWTHVGADVKDAAGGLLGVYALQIDPAAPDTVFAATEVGVFLSTDAGSSWQPFNEGLPNGIVRDLDFVADRRRLRAGVWGRGTFERQVGSPVPRDVSLYVRISDGDDGSTRPAPSGPDLYARQPRAASATASPDIKVSRDDPPSIAGVTAIDGVEFDDDIDGEGIVAGAATVFVQVHNRGSFPATGVRIACLWADASKMLPPLPADFWARFRAGTLPAMLGAWTLIGDAALTDPVGKGRDRVPPAYPRVQRFPINWPADISTHRRIGILVLVESAEDQLAATELDVGQLLASEPKVAYRAERTVSNRDDQTIRIEQTTRAQFTLAAPGAPLAPATAILAPGAALPIGPAAGVTGDTQAGFAVAPVAGNAQAITFSISPQSITVIFGDGIFNPAAATLAEVSRVVEHELFKHDAPVTVSPVAAGAGVGLQLTGVGGTVVQVTGGPAAAGLGLAPGPPAATIAGTVPAPFNLSAGAPQTLTLAVTKQATVSFAAQPDFNPTAAPARAVRRLLNRELAAAHLPIRAVTPRVDLWIRRSITDLDGIPTAVASHQLADLVASAAAVPAVGQPALFDLVKVHGADPIRPSTDNFLYLRATNLGNVDLATADSRHRLYALAMTASPITVTQIGDPAGVQQSVPARSSTIVELHWNPGAAATGDRLFVLAAVDDQTHTPLTVPATFATPDELDVFCVANSNAACRMLVVGA